MAPEGMARRRTAVLGLVILGHALLVVLFLQPDVLIKIEVKEAVLSVPLLDMSRLSSVRSPVSIPKPDAKMAKAKKLAPPPDGVAVALDSSPGSDAISSSDKPPSQLRIDWYQQAGQVASAQAESIFEEFKRTCAVAALQGEQRAECRKYKKPDAWVPQPKEFGINGGLPYLRLGKRCIVGLGFFGCGVGKTPDANAHVFDDMRDPDRPRSSAAH